VGNKSLQDFFTSVIFQQNSEKPDTRCCNSTIVGTCRCSNDFNLYMHADTESLETAVDSLSFVNEGGGKENGITT